MDVGKLAEYKEMMLICKEQGDIKNFEKYYELFISEYKKITGKDFKFRE